MGIMLITGHYLSCSGHPHGIPNIIKESYDFNGAITAPLEDTITVSYQFYGTITAPMQDTITASCLRSSGPDTCLNLVKRMDLCSLALARWSAAPGNQGTSA